jgi:hypothetical protein
MRSLVIFGHGDVALASARAGDGATVLAWTEQAVAALQRGSVAFQRPTDILTIEDADQIDDAAIEWNRAWGKRPLYDGRSFRELSVWQDVSLWWFAELYLFHLTGAAGRVRLIETFRRLLQATKAEEVEAFGLDSEETLLLARTCTSLGVLFHGTPRISRFALARRSWKPRFTARWISLKTMATALKASLAGGPPQRAAGAGTTVAFLSHAAFWRKRQLADGTHQEYEHYFDRLIPEVAGDPQLSAWVVAVGPRKSFRRRGFLDRLGEWLRPAPSSRAYVHMNRYTTWDVVRAFGQASREARVLWRRLRGSPGVHEAFSHAGVAFADLSERDLAGTVLLQLPWAVRCYEEMRGMLETVRPSALCLYAEDSGWGRATEAACRAADVPTIGVQHGILYPRYYAYQHAADEADCPRPDRTAVFGEAARRYLIEEGRYAADSLVVTGSPRFDELLEAAGRWDRAGLRAAHGVAPDERLLVVASRYRGIRRTHQSIGSAFADLVGAVERLERVRLVVKPHPAEPATPYEAQIRTAGAVRCRVLSPSADLLELLYAADALITVESLAAVEALVLGRPVVILNMPTNQRQLVERGVALGVAVGEDAAPAIEQVLFDSATQERIAQAREALLPELAFGLDGQATRRILDLIRQTAIPGDMVG